MPTICVDVMGSDQGPSVVLEGVERALAKDAELVVLLAGSDEEVTPFAEKHDRVRTVVSSEVIGKCSTSKEGRKHCACRCRGEARRG